MTHLKLPTYFIKIARFTLMGISMVLSLSPVVIAQVGIGTTNPKAFFNVPQGRTVLFGEDTNQVGSGYKLIWYASQGALRAGYTNNNSWSRSSANDVSNVGRGSFATGYSTIASGENSMAIGSGNYASGGNSIAMGNQTQASGSNSTAIGWSTIASGTNSTAIGWSVQASGTTSTAMGASVNTNQKIGSFILGDASGGITGNDAENQMMMRFAGGYKLFTNLEATLGVTLSSGGNAWQTLSDSTHKENFRTVDGASFLQKIAKMRLGSWNYKGQDARTYRHYGPMAQEFFSAFGHDELGVIGEQTSINQADFDGVNLIAIQALISENRQLKAKLAILEEKERNNHDRLDKIEALLQAQNTTQSLTFKP